MIRLTRRVERVAFYTADGRSVITEAVHADGEVYDDGAEYATYGDGGGRLIRRRPRFECRVMDANAAAKLRQWAAEGVAVSALELGRGRLGQFVDPVVPIVPASGSAGSFGADGYPVRLSSSLRLHRSGRSHDLFLDAFDDGDGDGVADGWTAAEGGTYAFGAAGQTVDAGGAISRTRALPLPGVRVAAFASLSSADGGGALRCVALDGGGGELESSETPIGARSPGYLFAPLTLPAGVRSVRVELVEAGANAGGLVASRVELVVARGIVAAPPVPAGVKAFPLAVNGGIGVTERVVALGDVPSTITLSYNGGDALGDEFSLVYDGAVVASTDGPVAGAGDLVWDYPAGAGSRHLVARVEATDPQSLWEYVLTESEG